MPQTRFQKLLEELLEKNSRGACSPEEDQFLQNWYNNIGNAEDTGLDKELKDQIEKRLWASVNPRPHHILKRFPWLIKAAAIITIPILGGLGLFLSRESLSTFTAPARNEAQTSNQSLKRVANTGNTTREIILADGSLVTLQPQSEIHYNKQFTSEIREVYLTGEAFFNVKRDPHRPFMVYANEVVTRVLGTSFNIKAYENDQEITVAVKTGKVSVYATKEMTSGPSKVFESKEVILTPNQQMVYNRYKEVVSKQLVEKPEIVLPNSNLFKMQFENADVTEIFEVLKENYGVEIRYDKNILDHCKLTTSMSDEGLYERIEVICKAIGASYFISDAVITIRSNGC